MPLIKTLVKNILLLAALYLLFRLAGNFSGSQSAVLTAVSWIGYELYEKLNLSHKTEDVFTPFRVSVFPKWHNLLSDFKLVRGENDWKCIYEMTDKLPPSTYSAFRHGFNFTVIKPRSSDSLPPGLAFWDDKKSFLNDLDLEVAIIETTEPQRAKEWMEKHEFFDHPKWSHLPCLCFKWGDGGYEIGLEVQMDWWKERCHSGELKELAQLKQDQDHICGTTRLVVATLPYSEFEDYYRKIDYDQHAKLQAEWDKRLKSNGWERKVERDSEIRDPWCHVEHKYFSVSHRSI